MSTAFGIVMPGRRPRRRGYILFEAVMALAVLCISLVALQSGMRQAIFVRGQARDYTEVRFLMENIFAKLNMQPQHVEGSNSGRFRGSKYRWEWEISKLELPVPPMPMSAPPDVDVRPLPVGHMAKIRVTVSWERRGRKFEETAETLWPPERLWLPPPEPGF